MAKITFIFCCILFFTLPGCQREESFTLQQECALSNLVVNVGDCTSDSTYKITINFKHHSAGSDLFDVFIRDNKKIGTYKLSDLPLAINNLKLSGKEFDFIKVIIKDNPECFAVAEFKPPACKEPECSIIDLKTDIGECNADGSYNLTINFDYKNPGNKYFDVFIREGKLIGTYELAKLPITIKNFKPSGHDHDFIKVAINDRPDCFAAIEFKPPACKEPECSIAELKTDIGECHADGTYNLTINFDYKNPGNKLFDVFVREGKLIGTYELAKLPITIKNFKPSGRDHDFIKVVINDQPNCFVVSEFKPPECKNQECSITDLKADIGECTSKTTYNLLINFNHNNSTNEYFEVFIRDNVRIGTYKLSALPLKLKDFKYSGKDFDYIRICINDNAACCKVLEFRPPNCD